MIALQMLFRSVLGILLGITVGAIVGGLIGMAAIGPHFVIGAMVLGAMGGSLVGGAAGLLKGVQIKEEAIRPRPVARAVPVRVRASAHPSGD